MKDNNVLEKIDELIEQLENCGDYGEGFRDGLFRARTIIETAAKEKNNESREPDGYG